MRFLPRRTTDDTMWWPSTVGGAAHLVDEGVLVARSALRMTLKNLVIMHSLRDAQPWQHDTITSLARDAVADLIAELGATAERIEADVERYVARAGRSSRTQRHRAELSRLTMRARTARGVVERLRELHDDPEAIDALVRVARDDMLTELTQARLQPEREAMQQSDDERRAAMEGVVADLLELQQQRDAWRELRESGW